MLSCVLSREHGAPGHGIVLTQLIHLWNCLCLKQKIKSYFGNFVFNMPCGHFTLNVLCSWGSQTMLCSSKADKSSLLREMLHQLG